MRAADIVNQLAAKLPLFSDRFTTNIAVSSLTQAAGVATATSVAHGLTAGKQVNIIGAKVPIAISSLTRSGAVGTLVTSTPHDMTAGYSTTVEIANAVEAAFNGTFTILTVPTRNSVTFTMADSGATVATGTPLLLNGSSYLNQYNGLRNIIAAPTPDTFTFAVPATLYSPARGTIYARSLPRISAVLQEDIIVDAYTKQPQNDIWAFVVLGDVTASKSRQTETDAVSNIQRGEHFRVQLIQPVTIYVVVPSAQEQAGRLARDTCEELLKPICQSLLMKRFDSLLTVGMKGPLQFVGHGFAAYSRAYYMHAYQFMQVADMTFGDTVGYDDDVAFRDIGLTIANNLGTGTIATASINLDGG
jgi:hypothetical protein